MEERQKGLYDSPIFLRGMIASKKGFRPSRLAGSGSQVMNHPYNKLSRKLSGMKRSRAAPPGPGASTRPTGKGQQLKTKPPAIGQKSALPQKKTSKLRDIQVLSKKSDLGGKQGADSGAFGKKRTKVVAEGKKRVKRETSALEDEWMDPATWSDSATDSEGGYDLSEGDLSETGSGRTFLKARDKEKAIKRAASKMKRAAKGMDTLVARNGKEITPEHWSDRDLKRMDTLASVREDAYDEYHHLHGGVPETDYFASGGEEEEDEDATPAEGASGDEEEEEEEETPTGGASGDEEEEEKTPTGDASDEEEEAPATTASATPASPATPASEPPLLPIARPTSIPTVKPTSILDELEDKDLRLDLVTPQKIQQVVTFLAKMKGTLNPAYPQHRQLLVRVRKNLKMLLKEQRRRSGPAVQSPKMRRIKEGVRQLMAKKAR